MPASYQTCTTTGLVSFTSDIFTTNAKSLSMANNHCRPMLWAYDCIPFTGDHRALIFKA
ncbi:Uncharacterised protein [Serratia fonticola]|nr:Uncharacterised protein [Serratia fonticola]CAI1804019.1 Uncharacterised protein [Serratia fonticola]CAI1836333.1 Uncharacterised protein [Serratia fonticola]